MDSVAEPIRSTLPMIPIDTLRHPQMRGIDAPHLQKMKEEIELDQELGLENQSTIDSKTLLKKDIDELTKSNDYRQVDKPLLRRMFKMGSMNTMCTIMNTKSFLTTILSEMWVILGGTFVGALMIMWACHLPKAHAEGGAALWALAVILFLSCLIIPLCVHRTINIPSDQYSGGYEQKHVQGLYFKWNVSWTILKMEDIKVTTVKIPFFAKLKIKEAMEKKIFSGFSIAYPHLDIVKRTAYFFVPQMVDPVILGIAADGRMYLVAWWNVKKEIDNIQQNIELLRKYKVSNS